MQHIVDDLLLLARADERGLPLQRIEVDLDDIVGAEIARLRSSNTVVVEPHLAPVRVLGDREMIARAVRNLTDNAARYARSLVSLSLRADGDDAVITVGDDGPGIPEAQRERIFDRFARVGADRRQGSGAGLGLAIVREIILAHDGNVAVAERTGGGVDFVVRLPMPAAENLSSADRGPAQSSRSR